MNIIMKKENKDPIEMMFSSRIIIWSLSYA